MTLQDWLPQVVELFNKTMWALLGQPFFALLLSVLVFLIAAGLLGWLIYLGRKRKL